MAKKRPTRKKKPAKAKSTARPRKKPVRRKKPASPRTISPGRRARIHQGVGLKDTVISGGAQGLSGVDDADSERLADKAGQSGDIQGLSSVEDVDPESVEELVEEGQAFEAEVVSGVENALDPDQAEVKTKEVPEDDVPPEYRDYREQDD